MSQRFRVEGIDYSPEGVLAAREELISIRGESMKQWPESVPFTLLASHIIALLADYAELLAEQEGSQS